MVTGSSLNPQQQEPKKWPQRVALVLAIFTFTLFGGAWFLNQKTMHEEASASRSLSPIDGQTLWISGQEQFRFEWAGPTEENTFIEVARDSEFRDLVLNEATTTSPFITDKMPGEGDYYYRLVKRTSSESLVLLTPTHFTVISQSPPELIYPFSAMATQENKTLRFYWQAKHGVKKYRLQLSFDNSFEHLLSDFVINETQSTPQNLPVGDFFWRVRGEGDTNAVSLWSHSRHLRIKKLETLAATKIPEIPAKPILDPEKNVVAFAPPPPPAPLPVAKSTKSEPSKVASLKSRPSKTTRSFGSDPTPTTKPPVPVVKKSVAKKSPPAATPLAKAKSTPSPAPERKPASIQKTELAIPRLKLPPDGVSLVALNGTQDPILFKWEGVEGAEKYRLELASDAEFKNFVHSTVSRENQVVVTKVLPKGQIYWRVRAEQGTSTSNWSPSFAIEK